MIGSIYFMRHGETDANEQNNLAGNLDVSLSDLGKKQAAEAGRIILRDGLRFDEVHTSDLNRTKVTARIALGESGQAGIPFIEAPEVRERDFGIFTGMNKNLLKKSFGYGNFERKIHSIKDFPESGETFSDMHSRVRKYYYNVLLPRIKAGRSILVVCHKYIIEMFAMILADLKVEDYFDFRLPNARPMSVDELVGYVRSESVVLKEFSDRLIYHSSWLIVLAALFGVMTRISIGIPLNDLVFLITTGALLGVSTFFISLGLNTNSILNSFSLKKRFLFLWCLKFTLSGGLLLVMKGGVVSSLAILFLMPPAFTAPMLSMLWGGSLYLAIEKTFLLSILSPMIMAGLLCFSGISLYTMFIPFIAVIILSMVIPTGIAQHIRSLRPIRVGEFVEHWRWIGVLTIILISFVSTYHFTPDNIVGLLSGESNLFINHGIMVGLVFLLIKIYAYLADKVSRLDISKATDIYITHSTPNIFLWISCISLQRDVAYIGFWASVAFFAGILMDEIYFTQRFNRAMHSICRTV